MSWEGMVDEAVTAGGVSFVSFYEANHDRVRSAAVAFCGDRDIAADATQEGFARAYARWRRLSRKPWAAAWVMTTALNICRRSAKSAQATVPLEPHDRARQRVSEVERVDVARALRRLPPRRRAAAVLFYIGDLSITDVAAAMRLSEGAVKAHLVLARRELRKEMERSHD